MTDLAWMAVCGLSVAAMGAVYLIDRRTWRRRARLLALQAQAATIGMEHARRARKQQIREAKAARLDDGDWSRPVTLGDADRDLIYAEISYCGPKYVAVYMRATTEKFRDEWIVVAGTRISVFDGSDLLMDAANGVGIARAKDVGKIAHAICQSNESFHQAKGGTKDAGVIQEEERGDRGRPGCDDHGPGDSRR